MKSKRLLLGISVILSLMMLGCGTAIVPTSTPTVAVTHAYVGSANSSVYHYPSCRSAQKIKEANQVWFSDVSEAKKFGYAPCKVCKPPAN
jgi:hypothetical protein